LYVRLAKIAETDRHDDREAVKFYEKAVEIHPRSREILASLSGVYERLGDDAGQARVLGVIAELDAEEGGAAPDTLYRLAQLRFKSNEVDAGCDAFEQAYDLAPDFDRGEELLKSAADRHPEAVRIVDIYERIARAANEVSEDTVAVDFGTTGRERSLVDALVRRWSLPGTGTEPMKEAVQIADGLEDRALAESLLRRYLEKEHEDKEGRVWALSLLAFHCESSSNVREAVLLKREAAELAEPADARRLLFEVAGLASGPLADLRLAATIYEELHEREPTDRDAWEMLLDVYRRTNDYDKLTNIIQVIVQYVDEPAERSKLRLERVKVGMDKLRLSDDDAANELREIVDDDPSAVDAAIMLGTLLERSGREEDLAELLGKQLEGAKDRQDADAVSSLSRRLGELLGKRDRAQAKDIYYAALDWDPKAKDILVALERIHDEDMDVEARSDVMEKRLALETGEAAESLALDLAETRRSLDDAAGSLRVLEVGFASFPESVTLKTRLEGIYREQLEFEKLAKLFEVDARARTDAKQRSARLRDAAQIWQNDLSDPEQASRVLREAREADPHDPLLLGELIDTLTASGELKAAASELTATIATLAEDDSVRTDYIARRAVLRSRLNDHEGALADFDDAVAKGKLDLRPYLAEHLGKMALAAAGRGDAQQWRTHRLRVAELRLAMNDIEDARTVLTELLKPDSKDRATLRAIAHVDELEERWDAASATYRRLVGLEEGENVIFAALKLAETCEKSGRLADARGGLERAGAAHPSNEDLRERLKWLYEQLGALKELGELVLEEARAVGDVGPRFDGLMRAGQLFLESAGDPNATQQVGAISAVEPLEEAHALRPADLDCAALLSDAYVTAGRFDDASNLLIATIGTFKGRRARELSALYHRLARIAEVLGDVPSQLQHLTTALDMDSQNGIVASELAYLAMEQGNFEVAQRALRQITMLKTAAPLPKALAYQHLGEIARNQGDNKRAMMLLKRAVDEDPNLDSARAIIEQMQAGA
jgi:tetratricopeptide (TPR) repeat protein